MERSQRSPSKASNVRVFRKTKVTVLYNIVISKNFYQKKLPPLGVELGIISLLVQSSAC